MKHACMGIILLIVCVVDYEERENEISPEISGRRGFPTTCFLFFPFSSFVYFSFFLFSSSFFLVFFFFPFYVCIVYCVHYCMTNEADDEEPAQLSHHLYDYEKKNDTRATGLKEYHYTNGQWTGCFFCSVTSSD